MGCGGVGSRLGGLAGSHGARGCHLPGLTVRSLRRGGTARYNALHPGIQAHENMGKEESTARFEQIRRPAEDSELKALYDEITAHGFGAEIPINWFTSQAIRPDILRATWNLVKGLMVEGELPATIKQMVAMAISVQNDCRYCQVVHSGALESLGVPRNVITQCVENVEAAQLPPAHRETLKFAVKAAKTSSSVTDEDFAVLRHHGLSDREILEVSMMAAFTNFINTWADLSGIALEED